MKTSILILAATFCQLSLLHAEDVTLWSDGGASKAITLNEGDTATCHWLDGASNYAYLDYTLDSKVSFKERADHGTSPPRIIAGPATIQLWVTQGKAAVTLQINRAGTASPPAAIPQEAGTTWEVILESSSDLVNWTPANPGQYSGTEVKRFFRTRMVKKEDP